MSHSETIQLLRDNGFNCFPIPPNQKEADYHYKASKTVPNQPINENENYGYIPILGNGTCIIDFDDKERYRKFAEDNISNGVIVIETPHGWHIPIRGLTGEISKVELFDYSIQDKKIIEIQGPDHYCVGPGSMVNDVRYKLNNHTIWNAKEMDFHTLIENICRRCEVEGKKKSSSTNYRMRQQFINGSPPTKGQSNDYFFQAAIQCNTDGLTEQEALDKIQKVYDKWYTTESFSNRPWSNIESKISEVYEKDIRIDVGRPRDQKIDRVEIATQILEQRKLYSVMETHTIYENSHGFLENVNYVLEREMIRGNPEMERADIEAVLYKLTSLAEPIPPTNKNLIVFKNGIYDRTQRKLVQTSELADMGFKEYDYLEPSEVNEPKQYMDLLFQNVDLTNVPRIKAMLKGAISRQLDPKISVIHGKSGVGKSTPLTVLATALGEYASNMELKQFMGDHFMRATLENKSLLVLQDLPKTWDNFEQLKTITGETTKSERGFHQDMKTFENKIKICGSSNYLAKIPEEEKDAMFTRRLSLIQNIRGTPYSEDTAFPERLAKDEGEKIISWILNLPDDECYYETPEDVKEQWEHISSPEIAFIKKRLELVGKDEGTSIHVMDLVDEFQSETKLEMNIKLMSNALKNRGFIVRWNVVENAKRRTIHNKDDDPKQQKIAVPT